MKTLALMTMALDIPTVIFSAYGMNFQNNWFTTKWISNHAFLVYRLNCSSNECYCRYLFHSQKMVLTGLGMWILKHPTTASAIRRYAQEVTKHKGRESILFSSLRK